MPETPSVSTLRTLVLVCACAIATSGCAQLENWLNGKRRPVAEEEVSTTAGSENYIDEMFRLASGDPATQAEIYADAEAAAKLTPSPSTRMQLALVLAAPGHTESDPERAQSMLRELLAATELLTPAEISLATIQLRDVEERLKLSHETVRMQEETSRAASSEQQAVTQRIAVVEAQNRALKESLAEAEQKLEAITSIERSIREQSDNGDNRR